MRRPWTDAEREFVRDYYGKIATATIAKRLRRSVKAVQLCAMNLGITRHYKKLGDYEAVIRKRHAQGWSDAEIAAEIKHAREQVRDWRQRLGLPHNAYSEHRRKRVAERTKQQCQAAGVKSLAEVRRLAFNRYAAEQGWPFDLRPRAVQILNLLHANGPMTRRQLSDGLGMTWRGSRRSLASNDPEGSYLAHLMKRGLVVCLGKLNRVTGQGKGHSTCLYALPLWLEKKA